MRVSPRTNHNHTANATESRRQSSRRDPSAPWYSPSGRARGGVLPRLSALLEPRSRGTQKRGPTKLRYGVEIEFHGMSLEQAASVVAKELPGSTTVPVTAFGKQGNFDIVDARKRTWEIKFDYPNLVELATPILKTHKDFALFKSLVAALKDAGASTPKHAGLHLHVEAKPFSVRKATNLLTFIAQHEWHLHDTLGVLENRRAECKPLDRDKVARLALSPPRDMAFFTANYAKKKWAGKQVGLNSCNVEKADGTFEYRYFNATTEESLLDLAFEFVMGASKHGLTKRAAATAFEVRDDRSVVEMCDVLELSPTSRDIVMGNAPQTAGSASGSNAA